VFGQAELDIREDNVSSEAVPLKPVSSAPIFLFDDIVSEDMSLEDTSSGDRCLEDTGFERYRF
jgi:hypothetical protein